MHCEGNKLPPSWWFRGGRYEEERGRERKFLLVLSSLKCLEKSLPVKYIVVVFFFLTFVYVLNILHVKRRDTFPKRNKGRDDTRDEEKSLLPSDSEGEEDVEGPPKGNL